MRLQLPGGLTFLSANVPPSLLWRMDPPGSSPTIPSWALRGPYTAPNTSSMALTPAQHSHHFAFYSPTLCSLIAVHELCPSASKTASNMYQCPWA